jgi:hypothetical protein
MAIGDLGAVGEYRREESDSPPADYHHASEHPRVLSS